MSDMQTALKQVIRTIPPLDISREIARFGEISVSLELIHPETAEIYLQKNVNNRPLSKYRVGRYAGMMSRGQWKLNGETIIFDRQGRLMNGQTRLNAVILSGEAIHTLVVRGIEPDSFLTMDQGKTRTHGDILSISGETNTNVLAAALRIVVQMGRPAKNLSGDVTADQLQHALNTNQGIRGWISIATKSGSICSISILAGLLYLMSSAVQNAGGDDRAVVLFGDALASGEGLFAPSPILTLRSRLIAIKAQRAKPNRADIAAMIIVAWNAYIEDRPLKALKTNVEKHGMPDISGGRQARLA